MKEIVEPLLAWYEQHHRVLPWRESRNPYYIWISEIMLQQTRVEAVKPYFNRFITALPTVEAVAACPEDQLLKLWEGLGYYNRVRNIQKAAVRIVEEYGGQLPANEQKLLDLPGIGSYTAGAIASIAYELPVPAVDGNVLRVYARIRECYDDIMKQSVRKRVEQEFRRIMPQGACGTFNQALMELGAMVCVPNGMAKCESCPLQKLCKAHEHGTVKELPVRKKTSERRREEKTVLVSLDGERVAVRKRPSRGLLAGLYELPNLEGHKSEDEVLEYLKSYALLPLQIQPAPAAKHIFSHVEWHMTGYIIRIGQLDRKREGELIFAEVSEVEENYPIPAAFAAYSACIEMKLGQEKFE